MYQRILVAVDGSPWSDAASAYATALAARTGAALCLLAVAAAPAMSAMPEVMGGADDLVVEAVERQSRDVLARALADAEGAGVAYATFSKWGNVPETSVYMERPSIS